MYAFLVSAIPLSLLFYTLTDRKLSFKDFILPATLGAIIGTAVCICKEFLVFTVYVEYNSFIRHIAVISKQTVLPIILIYGAFCLASKDKADYKIASFFPLLAAYYAVYLPYITISDGERHSFFVKNINPLMLTATLFFIQFLLNMSSTAIKSKNYKKLIPAAAFSAVSFFMMPLVQTMWYFAVPEPVCITVAAVITIASLCLFRLNMFFKRVHESISCN